MLHFIPWSLHWWTITILHPRPDTAPGLAVVQMTPHMRTDLASQPHTRTSDHYWTTIALEAGGSGYFSKKVFWEENRKVTIQVQSWHWIWNILYQWLFYSTAYYSPLKLGYNVIQGGIYPWPYPIPGWAKLLESGHLEISAVSSVDGINTGQTLPVVGKCL